MLSKSSFFARVRIGVGMAVLALGASLAVAAPAGAASAPAVGTFQTRASSPKPINNVVTDPHNNMIYAQQFEGSAYYRYNPRTNKWTTLAPSPIKQINNGGAAYLNGNIYTVYPQNSSQMGVYNVASGTWSTITNPLGVGTADITAVGNLLYLVEGSSFISYDPATNTTQTLASPPFSFEPWGGLAAYKGTIYGQQGDGDVPTNYDGYDIATNTWGFPGTLRGSAVLGAAIDPVTGIFYAYGTYGDDLFYRYNTQKNEPLTTLQFPHRHLNDGGLAYVSTTGLQGIYATYGQDNKGFTRYVTPRAH
jgi:hypothetical protein